MKVEITEALNIKEVGIFILVDNWESFKKWETVDKSQLIITATNKDEFFSDIFQIEDEQKQINIVMADMLTQSLLNKLKG